LIDEIGDLPLELQAKLLRVLERGEVTRVGGQNAITVDVRVLAATRRNLDHEVLVGRFRDDLFHRLVVTRVELPPLRHRQGDIALLAQAFAERLGGGALPSDLVRRWEDYAWPGNVRELRNAVARWAALGELADEGPFSERERPRTLAPAAPIRPDSFASVLALDMPLTEAREKIVAEFEQRYVEHVLEQAGGNVTRAAAIAGVGRRHLQRMRARGGSKE
jgi:transcriptional regulator with GAF, ATPase, and Fis domain